MKKSQLLRMKQNLSSMDRSDLEETCSILIDIVLASSLTPVRKRVSNRRERKRDPNSASEQLRADRKIWPAACEKKYPRAFLHRVRGYVYARTKEYGTKRLIDKPIAHYVWKIYMGKFPTKGRRLTHLDGDSMNNEYKNLHPIDGIYR